MARSKPRGFTKMDRLARLKALTAQLDAIPPAVLLAMEKVTDKNADELMMQQRRVAEKLSGDLARSIRKYRTNKAATGKVGTTIRAGGALTTRKVDNPRNPKGKNQYDYALANEFGTYNATTGEPAMEKQPFFFAPYRAKKRSFNERMRRAAKKAIAQLTEPHVG